MMNFNDKLKKQLIRHEGMALKPYHCTANKLTIGVGRNLEDNGISKDEAMYLLDNDIKIALSDAHEIFAEFDSYPENVQIVICDMLFNLGINKYREFVSMIEAIRNKDWNRAALEMVNSKWFRQVGNRGINLFNLIKQGS